MRRTSLAISLAAFLTGCTHTTQHSINLRTVEAVTHTVAENKQMLSFSLESLCDTPIQQRTLDLYLYVAPDEKLWEYRDYKKPLLERVARFFAQHHITCTFHDAQHEFTQFTQPNEIGIEVYAHSQDMQRRFLKYAPPQTDEEKNEDLEHLKTCIGKALTSQNIVLINGAWRESSDFPREEIEAQFNQDFEGTTKQEYILCYDANNIAHEVLHCLGLMHPSDHLYRIARDEEEGIPNIMSYRAPIVSPDYPVGATMNFTQEKLAHSALAGNNTYKALRSTTYEKYVENIKKENKE